MRVLVCGGRDYLDRAKVFAELDKLGNVRTLIHGNASGADRLADSWAVSRKVAHVIAFAADWATHGPAAGPMRNQRMIDKGKPELVVAFPGGRGTADMVKRAKAAGVEVIEIKPEA